MGTKFPRVPTDFHFFFEKTDAVQLCFLDPYEPFSSEGE